jgi:hypothetical protein
MNFYWEKLTSVIFWLVLSVLPEEATCFPGESKQSANDRLAQLDYDFSKVKSFEE